MTKLTEKQQAFVANKAAGVTNRDAAIAAGYAVAGAAVAADKLMRNPAVRTAIKAASKSHSVDIAADKQSMPRKHYANSMTFMLDVMNHPKLPTAMRMDAAKHLLPYQHARMGEQGKKDKAKERAHAVAKKPRFRPKLPPHLTVVKGGREE